MKFCFDMIFFFTGAVSSPLEIANNDANWIKFGVYSGKYRKVVRKLPSDRKLNDEADSEGEIL